MINETNIACFLSVAETQNFTESARRLFLSQQAVSKNVMQLEADVGFNLIDRAKRGAALTPEGEQYRKLLLQISDTYEIVELLKKNYSEAAARTRSRATGSWTACAGEQS